jgi:PAS domain S-box-containing protein
MTPAPIAADDPRRLKALKEYDILDTLPEKALDDLTALAARLCHVPMATISLVDEDRQWFKSRLGMEMTGTPRAVSFCGHTIQQREVFIVPDALQDERFADNPLVTGEPGICFYAGAPLVNDDNVALGALCVMDHQPHTLDESQKEVLQLLARQIMTHLELRRHARKLRESEERLRLVTNNAQLGLVVVDRERRYVFANSAYADILGLPSAEIVGRRVPEVLASIYETQIGPRLDRAFAGERVSYELQKPDGAAGSRYYEVRYEPTKPGGTVEWVELVVVVIAEITERKLGELSARRLAAIVESSEDAIIGMDLDGVVTSWNRGAETVFGHTEGEMAGQSILRLVPEERKHEERQILDCVGHGESVNHFETQRLTKDGRLIDVSVTASPVRDKAGEVIGVSKVARDITAQKKAERQIAEQAALLDKAQDAILVRDLEGRITFWNRGAERLYGWTPAEVLGRNAADLFYADPARFREVNGLAIEQGEWNGELQHRSKAGQALTVEARWTLIRDEAGRAKSILAINTDVTEKKKIEAQFMRAQRMESIGVLAGGVAHDLNNILAPILMSVQLLKTMCEGPDAEMMLDTLEISAKRGADIVQQVLTFARGVEGQRLSVEAKYLLKDLATITRDTFPKNIQLEFTCPALPWRLRGDPTQLHQVLLNLCVNARDAMPQGGKLKVTAECMTVDEHYAAMNLEAKPGRYVVITVTDTGTGIPREVLDHIFEPFFTTKEVGKGTGLGLSTVRAIVTSHGGFVNVYSEPGQGTAFRCYFPAAEDSGQTREEGSEAASLPRGHGELILLVDDEASIRAITGQTLDAYGYRTLTASDGAEALALYAAHQEEIAVVITDMAMPILDGRTTVRALLRINPAVKIIGASGLKSAEHGGNESVPGIRHFLGKPFTAETLLAALSRVLGEGAEI